MYTGLVIALAVLGFVLTVKSPHWGFLFYWFWFLVRPQEVFVPGPLEWVPIERILFVTLLLSLLVRQGFSLAQSDAPVKDKIVKAVGIFLFVNYLSIVTAIWRGGAFEAANELGKMLLWILLGIYLVTSVTHLRRFLWIWTLTTALAIAFSAWSYVADPYVRQGIQRATGLNETWRDPNTFSACLVLWLPFALTLIKMHKSKVLKLIIFLTIFGSIAIIVLSASRTSFVALVILFLMLAWQSKRRVPLLMGAFLLLIITWFAMPQRYRDRINTLQEGYSIQGDEEDASSERQSAHGRVMGFQVALKMFLDRPILGVGAGCFPAAFFDKGNEYSYKGKKIWLQPHNLPGQLMSELGVVGILAFGALLVRLFKRSAELSRRLSDSRYPPWMRQFNIAVFSTLVLLIVFGFAGHDLYRFNWYIDALLIVLLTRFIGEHDGIACNKANDIALGSPAGGEDAHGAEAAVIESTV